MSLYKRERSRYIYINISYGGKRMRVTSRCENKRDAEKVKLLLLIQLMQGIYPTAQTSKPRPTFREGSEQYLKEMCIGKKAAWKREALCHRDLVPFFGEQRVDQITTQLVLKWREQEAQRIVRTGKQISPRSVNYNLGYLKRFFNYAIDIQGWVKDNSAAKIKPLKENNKRDRVLSEDEEKRLLDACEHDWIRRVLAFGIETGLRFGEIASLRTGDFHLDRRIPHFRKEREKNELVTEFPVVSERLATVIHRQMVETRTTDHFFTDEDGHPASENKINYWFRKARTKAGIKNLMFHDLRRTFYSTLRNLGCNFAFAEYLMGHKIAGITSRYLVIDLAKLWDELIGLEEKKKNSVTHLSHFKKTEDVPVSVLTTETIDRQGFPNFSEG